MIQDYPISLILSQLERNNLLPAIIFRSARAQCDQDVQRLSYKERLILSADKQEELVAACQQTVKKLGLDPKLIKDHEQYRTLVTLGVGAHHAGQLLGWRILLEELMSRSMLRLLIATGTVAAGHG